MPVLRVIPSQERVLRELEQIRDQARQLHDTLDAIYTQLLDLEQCAHGGPGMDKLASKQQLFSKEPANYADT